MIVRFSHKGLERLFKGRGKSRLPPDLAVKIGLALDILDVANGPEVLDQPGYRLHMLSGKLAGFWSIRISGNWRIIFRFEGENVCDVDLIDYH